MAKDYVFPGKFSDFFNSCGKNAVFSSIALWNPELKHLNVFKDVTIFAGLPKPVRNYSFASKVPPHKNISFPKYSKWRKSEVLMLWLAIGKELSPRKMFLGA